MKKAIVDVVRAYALLLPIIAWLLQGGAIPFWVQLLALLLGVVFTYCIAEDEAATQGSSYSFLIACEGVLVAFFSAKHEGGILYDHFVLCAAFVQIVILTLYSMKGDKKKE